MSDPDYVQRFIHAMWTLTAMVAIGISLELENWEHGFIDFALGVFVSLIPATISVWFAFPISVPLAMLVVYLFDLLDLSRKS